MTFETAARTAAGAALLAAGLALLAPPAAAQGLEPPARRTVTLADTDLPGGDIRSIFDTSLEFCESACRAEPACRAYTFNQRNNSCFLKREATQAAPYRRALSAVLIDQPAAALARARERQRDLSVLPEAMIAAAHAQALALGRAHPLAETDLAALRRPVAGEWSGARDAETLARHASEANRLDSSFAWAQYARAARAVNDNAVAVPAAINAYLRAADPSEQATALLLLAEALERTGQGRLSVPVLRLAAAAEPDAEIDGRLERAIGLFGFRVSGHEVEADAAEPRVCVSFSEELAEAGVDYARFLRMPERTLPVEVAGSQLCLTGLRHGETFRFTVREGLPSAKGDALVRSSDFEVYVRDRAPAVRFTGRAYVLPRSRNVSVPVVSVNLSEVEIRIFRIGERNLMPTIQDGMLGANLAEWGEGRIAQRIGEEVWRGRAEVARRVNEDVTTALPLGEAVSGFRPGIYVMTARVPGEGEYWEDAATQWFIVTDLGLATASGTDGLHVFVRALSSAAAREGVRLRLLAENNEVLGEAVTDAEGHAVFPPGLLRGQGGMAPALVTAEAVGGAETDFAFLSLREPAFDLSDRGVEGRLPAKAVDVFLSTERGAYRPGETVFATILARDPGVAAVAGLTLTAIVTRPDGKEHARAVLPDAAAGGRVFRMALPPGAQRGTWRLRIHADPKAEALATTAFLVEDFVPERIDFTLAMPEGPVSAEAPPPVTVAAVYLYGAPGAGLAIEGETAVRASRDLPGFPGFQFGLAADEFAPRFQSLEGGLETDAAGNAEVPLALPEIPSTSRPLTVTTHVRLAEGSGRPVERTIARPLAPQGLLLGIRPLFDGVLAENDLARFEVVAVGQDLARTEGGRVGWTLSRIETDWQWYRLDGNWYYEAQTRRTRVANGEVTVAAEGTVRIEAPVTWGRYELRLVTLGGEARAAASTEFYAGWYVPSASADTPDVLAVGLDRPAYAPGDTARLRLVARDAGTVLVRVMGETLVDMRAVEVGAGESFVDIPVTEAWGPGAYVTATLLRPMDEAARRGPNRAIGLVWAGVAPGDRRLRAEFAGPAEADPRGPLEAVLRVEGARPGDAVYATIAAVDLGILNLTGFAPPDPSGYYFGQRKLGMELRDLYGRLIDGLQGDPGRLREGGDGDLTRPMDVPPLEELVAQFAGPLRVGEDGTVRARFDIPDFNGTVRLMAVVWSERAVGEASRDVLVRDPVVVTAGTPRFLAPGDRARIRLDLAHAAGPAGEVLVEVAAGPGLAVPSDRATARVALAEQGRASLSVPVTAMAVGDPTITVTVTTPDGRRLVKTQRLPVRANDPAIARTTRLTLAPAGGRLVLDENAFEGILPGTGRATLAVGPLARFDVPALLEALDTYPYGCTEQITSRALPLVYLDGVAASMRLASREGVRERVAEAIQAVLGNQTGAGAFGLWRPEEGDLWLDSYVTDFLSRARAAGHAVPETAFRLAVQNLRNRLAYAQDFEKGGEDIAYALLVLARENAAAIGDLRYYADIKAAAFATPLAKAQLGLALAYYGDQVRADAMFALADRELRAAAPDDRGWRMDYGSSVRDAAAILALAVEARSEAVDREALARIVAPAGSNLRWRSTQENAWTLLAAHALIGEVRAGGVTIDGRPAEGPLVRLLEQGRGEAVTVLNSGPAPLDAVISAFGVPDQPEPAGGDGYRIERSFHTLDGAAVDPALVPRSERLVVVLTVTPERDRNARLIVNDPLPAGFEIDNPNLIRGGDTARLAWLDAGDVARHAEFRSDRFLAAVDWSGAAPFRLAYIVRAVSPGTFHLPAASVEDMYRPEFRARTASGEITVTD